MMKNTGASMFFRPTATKLRRLSVAALTQSKHKKIYSASDSTTNAGVAGVSTAATGPSNEAVKRPVKTGEVGYDDFDVVRTLGEGAFGKVLLVQYKYELPDAHLGDGEEIEQLEDQLFALKVLQKAFIVDSGNVTRAVAEKEILQVWKV
jgi:serine/threonine protein kinase